MEKISHEITIPQSPLLAGDFDAFGFSGYQINKACILNNPVHS
ncbi:hypothetical protein ADICYQ_2647 [Cyclobacterium qasimii M12-11B]|uniref:Uncharacterized protein n=1 Tax=Cyclobacterium qasimii M12-11B TaxID=641524 RepID=S7VDN4_9BACT|nr:hypothetical protein ADICYQ_2647 [Cyclobacterium qasimii M12-11B]